MSRRPCHDDATRGLLRLTHAAIAAVLAACWLGIFAALVALPLVLLEPARLLGAVPPSALAAHGDGSHLLMHFSAGLLMILGLLVLGVLFLRHLQRFVGAVGQRQPFSAGNVQRLRRMAWLMLAMELLSIVIGLYTRWMGPPFAWMEVGGGMSVTGLIAVLMLFVMVRVFAVGTAMREDLDGLV